MKGDPGGDRSLANYPISCCNFTILVYSLQDCVHFTDHQFEMHILFFRYTLLCFTLCILLHSHE